MTAQPEANASAIPLKHAALCVDCDCVFDTRILIDQKLATCRDHTWVRLARWVPPMPDDKERE